VERNSKHEKIFKRLFFVSGGERGRRRKLLWMRKVVEHFLQTDFKISINVHFCVEIFNLTIQKSTSLRISHLPTLTFSFKM
jgi:hypothetical protein